MKQYPYRKIFLQNILHNLEVIQTNVTPAKVMAVIKSDAYGHHMLKVATLLEKKADYFLLDRLQDAIELRKNNITTPIFLSSLFPSEITHCAAYNIEFALSDWELVKFLKQNPDIPAKIHIKVDTGMGRLGFAFCEYEKVLCQLLQLPQVQIQGVCSHFARSEEKQHPHNQKQILHFQQVIQKTKEKTSNNLFHNLLFHMANSGAIICLREAHFSMVRTGLLLYGVYHANSNHQLPLKPALELISAVLSVKKIQAGETVSYGQTWKAKKSGNLALIALGYGDGLLRSLNHSTQVLIAGKKYPIVGKICMGIIAVFLGQKSLKVAQEVVLLGKQGRQKITVETLATNAGSISHEILTSIGKVKNFQTLY